MGWEIANSWEDLQGVNTGHSEELANGKIAFWRTEDWEIYGPGGGGYTSAGPFDSVEDDLQAWVTSGSLLAQDVINWHENGSTSSGGRPNFNKWQQASLNRKQKMYMTSKAGNATKIENALQKGVAKPFNGNANPQLGGDIQKGDIVVIGHMSHPQGGESVRYRVFSETDTTYTDFAESYDFLDIARRDADAEIVEADFSRVGGVTPILQAAFDKMKQNLATILARLTELPEGSHFNVTFRRADGTPDSARIRISELISWFRLVDFEIWPTGTNFENMGVGATIYTNRGVFQAREVRLLVDQQNFELFGGTGAASLWYLFHEVVGHASEFGQGRRRNLGNGTPLERHANRLSRDIAIALGLRFDDQFTPGDLTPSSANVYDADMTINLVRGTV